MPDAILRLSALNFEGAGLYRQPTQRIPLAKQGKVLLAGAEGCLDSKTFITFEVRDPQGRRINSKGGTIERLYQRFNGHAYLGQGIGKGKSTANWRKDVTFWVSSMRESTGRIFKNQVLDVVFSGEKECFRLETAAGFVIEATSDHLFWTGSSYTKLGELTEGSTVFVHKNTHFRIHPPGRARNRDHALEQDDNLRFIAVKDTVSSITQCGVRETYDIKVMGPDHNFVANNMVVHNSGKSMIPEVATLVLYGKGSPRLRKSGLVESSIVNADTGYRGELTFESGSGASLRKVSITQAFKHPRLKSRYIITVDGQREEPTTKPEQKKLVKRLAPLSYEEWLGVVYLHQGGVHDLLAGTPTEKREYLTSVFGLDFYDDLLTAAKEEAKALERKGVGALDLQQTLADIKQELASAQASLDNLPPMQEIEDALQRLSARMLETSSTLGSLRTAKADAERVQSMRNELADLALDDPASELQQAQSEREGLVEKRTAIKGKLSDAKRLTTAYESAVNRATAAKSKLTKAEDNVAKLRKATGSYPDETACTSGIALCDEAIGLNLDAFDPEATGSEPWRERAKTAMSLRDQSRKLEKLQSQLKSHKHSGANCPTCAQPLQLDALAETIAKLTADANDAEKSATSSLSAEMVALVGPLKESNFLDLKDSLTEMKEEHAALQRAVEALPALQQASSEADEALADTPKPPDTKELRLELENVEKAISGLDGRIQRAQTAMRLEDQIEAIGEPDLKDIQDQIQKLEAKQQKTKTKYDEAQELKREATQASTRLATLTKQQKQVQKQIDDHAETALLLKGYEQEIVPYFTALRASKVKSCVSVLESVLPVYIGAMSANQYEGAEVKLVVSDDLKDVDLTLRTGHNLPWISAVQASGGQRRRFTLAILAALREVSPRKANVMFFDEPFADLEGDGKLLFVNRLMPLLMDRCQDLESIFLIAHDAEVLQVSNDCFDSVWMVERDGQSSTITMNQKLANVAAR